MGSSRLPGKVLEKIGDKTAIEHVVSRCQGVEGADAVVCATSDLPRDDALADVASRAGAFVVRGSESDVLGRYVQAAQAVNADVVMRITADCPLIDSEVCAALLRLRAKESADYASNAMPRSYPIGLDCEAFTFVSLVESAASTHEPFDREHATQWLIRAPQIKKANLHSGREELGYLRWVLDYREDLEFMRAVFEALPADSRGHMADVLAVLKSNPHIAEINARHAVAAAGVPR
jgi:spore coat polysaccharide biosynthesis protein SpsF (cytidylyltransferase family)